MVMNALNTRRTLGILFAVLTLVVPARALAQTRDASGDHVIRILGASTRFSPPVNTVTALRRMATTNRADLEKILGDAGLSSISAQVMDKLTNGTVENTTMAPGSRLAWMALRRKGTPDIIHAVRWEGKTAFAAYRFTVETATTVYTFVVPKACGNLSLVESVARPGPAPAPTPARPPTPAPPPTPLPPTPIVTPPPTPAPPPTPVAPAVVPPQTPAPVPQNPTIEAAKLAPFILGAFGKQRRTLQEDDAVVNPLTAETTAGVGNFCDPLLGVKGGVQFMVRPHFMIAPAVGVAFNLDEGGRTSLFAEVEFNRVFDNGGLVGAGIGIYDFNHSDNITPHLLLHAAVPIAKTARGNPMLFAFEARLPFDEFSDISNNYQFWAGLRYAFK